VHGSLFSSPFHLELSYPCQVPAVGLETAGLVGLSVVLLVERCERQVRSLEQDLWNEIQLLHYWFNCICRVLCSLN